MSDDKHDKDGKGQTSLHEPVLRTGKLIKPIIIEKKVEERTDKPAFISKLSSEPSDEPNAANRSESLAPIAERHSKNKALPSFLTKVLTDTTNDKHQSNSVPRYKKVHSTAVMAKLPQPTWLRKALFFFVAVGVIVGILFAGGIFKTLSLDKQFSSYETLWKTGNYKDVLLAATDGNKEAAQMIVLKAVNKELELPKEFRADILTFGLNPVWEKDLSNKDKQALYTYASSSILAGQIKKTVTPENLHPGILLAVIGNLGLRAPLGKLAEIPTQKFADLPSPFGVIFKKLTDMGVATMSAPQARALARILANHDDEDTVAYTIAAAKDDQELLELVRLSAPFGERSQNLAPNFLKTLAIRPGILGDRIRWFNEPSGVDWNTITPLVKLFLACGVLLGDINSDDALIDVTLFPDATVRDAATKKLAVRPQTQEIFKLIQAASLNQIFITRPQLVGLNSLLQVPEMSRDAFIAQWFQSKPDPTIVLFLLLQRSAKSPNDIFNLNAAEYLAGTQNIWNASYDTLKHLSEHPEPLARTLAFGRLNPEAPEQRKILQDWYARETAPAIKEQLGERLKNVQPN